MKNLSDAQYPLTVLNLAACFANGAASQDERSVRCDESTALDKASIKSNLGRHRHRKGKG